MNKETCGHKKSNRTIKGTRREIKLLHEGMKDTIKIVTEIVFFLRDHYGTQCSDGGERLQVNIQSTGGDYTLAEVRNSMKKMIIP